MEKNLITIALKAARSSGCWTFGWLLPIAHDWYQDIRKGIGYGNERGTWWIFTADFNKNFVALVQNFQLGLHQFSPMRQYRFTDDCIQVWSYLDRLAIHLLLNIMRPTFKYIISPLCLHLIGPAAIKGITAQIKAALNTGRYHYCLRIDIRSYYASINHKVLVGQLAQHFADPILLRYLKDIVTIAIDRDSQLFLPTQGIPVRSALSPFFGALYLSSLDQAFAKKKGAFYLRFMDDVIILVKTKRQYSEARKILFKILKKLKLEISPHKTRMGRLGKGFHFLGIAFAVSQNPQNEIQAVTVGVHSRTPRRALDMVAASISNAVPPALIQKYLSRWATWWHHVSGLDFRELLVSWVTCALLNPGSEGVAWIGRGLLLGSRASGVLPLSA